MMQYLLDTDICVEFLRGRFNIYEKILKAGIENCLISEITIAELTFGAYQSGNFDKHIREVREIESLFEVIPSYGVFPHYAQEKVKLKSNGILIPDFDLIIGSTSVFYRMIMVTNNEKHLTRISGINIQNWVENDLVL